MQTDYEKRYHDLEESHWWFKGRRVSILKMLADAPRDIKILDVGCSSGLLLSGLEKANFKPEQLFGIDISEKAIARCKSNGLSQTYVMNAQDIQLEKGSFDLLIASDCLEHIESDRKALDHWHSLLKENGMLMVFVPAFMFLWSGHDEVNLHCRRYTQRGLKNKVKDAQFTIVRSGYWNILLFLPLVIIRLLNRLTSKSSAHGDLKMPPGFINILLLRLLRMEDRMARMLKVPFGVSTYCIAKKA